MSLTTPAAAPSAAPAAAPPTAPAAARPTTPAPAKTSTPNADFVSDPARLDMMSIPAVDAVGLEQRAGALASRSIKTSSKKAALEFAIACMDLTTLEGSDTPGKILSLCQKALRPDPTNPALGPVAAVCVYPYLVPAATQVLAGSPVAVASVAGSFPSGLAPLSARTGEIRWSVAAGATEIDIVLNRSAFLSGRYSQAFDEIAASKEACGDAHLKVILEVGELGSYDQIRRASTLAALAGADFIKTSTGKTPAAATPANALCMAEAIRDISQSTGRQVGLKLAGGIRTAKQAWQYAVIVAETLGPDWLTPRWFRLGASTLLNDVLMQHAKLTTGRYQRPESYTIV